MPKFAEVTEISDKQAVALLRKHIQGLPPPPAPEYKRGDAVRLDTGDIGVVESFDEDGQPNVYYLDHEGRISGPAFGYRLSKLDL